MSDIRTQVGPYPPHRPKGSKPYDGETYVWSRCAECGWYAAHVEERDLMQHCIEVAEHRCADAVQLELFGALA